MFADIHFIDFLRANPALAVFVTLALGFLVGKLRWRSFSLGTVTSVLLVGVVVGQLKIEIPEPAKTLFFLLFLFSVGYAVGPQFFRGLKRDGLPQVGFAVVVCLLCLGSTWLCATLMGYDVAQAAGLLAGSQTMSAVLGVATDTIRQLPDGQAIDLDAMPVCYAVTYIFGTAGSAWILGTLGPRLLGGVEKVHKAALDLESKLGDDVSFTAGFDPAARAIVFRAYKAENDWFGQRRTVAEFERYMQSQKKLIFVERLRQRGRIVDDVTPRTTIYPGDTLVVSGRRQYVIEEEDWIGTEVEDAELTNFSVQSLPVVVSKRGAAGQYVRNILKRKEMHGVNIRSILRAGVKIPVLAGDRNIRRETRERVSRLAGELGYRPNPVAVNLRSGRSNTVGVIVPEMVTPFAATVIGGIQRVLYGRGLKVIIAQSDENPQTECGNLELMERFMVDGVIACPCDATRNGEIYRRIRQRGVPLVFYDRAPLRVDASRVIVDDFATSYFLMEHLVRRGCRRIVHLGGPAHIPNARERLRGFRYALGKFGFVSDGRSVIPAGVTFDDGRAAADELLRRMPDADGLFAWTDTVAIGAMNRLRELGIRVPAQMAVAGYSGTVLSTIVNPQLTTVEQPLDEMGCRAAELILEKIADPSAPDRTVTLTACIRERASTAR